MIDRVSRLPLRRLWDDDGEVDAVAGPYLDEAAVRARRREGRACFVVANIGNPLVWHRGTAAFAVWKQGFA